MKGPLALLGLLSWAACLGAAQDLDLNQIVAATPSCALPCLIESLPVGNCSLADQADLPRCACTSTPLQSSLSVCVQKACTFEEQVVTSTVLGQMCAAFPKESRQTEVKATAIACLALTVFIVALRCISRLSVSSRLWWDDWTTLLATAFLVGICSVKIVGSDLGFGLHYWNVDPTRAPEIFQLFYAAQMIYILIQVTAKVSILTLFWRIFTARWFRISVWCCVAFLVSHGLLFLLLVTFQCIPVDAIWDRSVSARCLNITAIGWAGAIFSILEDLVILALPVPEVLKLQLTFRKKVAVCLMFGIGSFACVTSMVRLRYMVTFANSMDATWDNVDIVIWSIIEVTCAIICGSLPTLRPLLQKVPGLLSSARKSEYFGGGGTNNSATLERSRRTHSEVIAPTAFRKLSDAPWEVEASRDRQHKRGATSNVTFNDTVSEAGSRDDMEMAVLAKEKSTV